MKDYSLPKCPECGDTMPPWKRLCWCCEHKKTLHPMEAKPGTEGNQRETFQKKDGDTSESQGLGEHPNGVCTDSDSPDRDYPNGDIKP